MEKGIWVRFFCYRNSHTFYLFILFLPTCLFLRYAWPLQNNDDQLALNKLTSYFFISTILDWILDGSASFITLSLGLREVEFVGLGHQKKKACGINSLSPNSAPVCLPSDNWGEEKPNPHDTHLVHD